MMASPNAMVPTCQETLPAMTDEYNNAVPRLCEARRAALNAPYDCACAILNIVADADPTARAQVGSEIRRIFVQGGTQ